MSASEENNPICIIVKDVQILSDKNLSKTVDILIDQKHVNVELQADKAPDKAWRLKDGSVLSESLMIRSYHHQSFYRPGEKKPLTDIAIKASDMQDIIISWNGPTVITDYEITQDSSTVIVGVKRETHDIEAGQADIVKYEKSSRVQNLLLTIT
ncbi:hypothetical protein EWM64_g10803 [Hericium alpestre]|uniref:Uncharacterized protein n=1 Tax=Hericium alpestre TaxID=135208 RepID=A0A4Y9ZIE2_9AGAM|nr:hypothetical protein EWM64_g10803 [Hericium alpestre]